MYFHEPKSVKFFFTEDIQGTILFRRVERVQNDKHNTKIATKHHIANKMAKALSNRRLMTNKECAKIHLIQQNKKEVEIKHYHASFFEYPFATYYVSNDTNANASTGNSSGHCTCEHSEEPCGCSAVSTHFNPVISTPIDSIVSLYQSNDGQLYFLHPRQAKSIKGKPETIYGEIENIRRYDNTTNEYEEFSHVLPNQSFFVVTLKGMKKFCR